MSFGDLMILPDMTKLRFYPLSGYSTGSAESIKRNHTGFSHEQSIVRASLAAAKTIDQYKALQARTHRVFKPRRDRRALGHTWHRLLRIPPRAPRNAGCAPGGRWAIGCFLNTFKKVILFPANDLYETCKDFCDNPESLLPKETRKISHARQRILTFPGNRLPTC